jgi:hypothetical protein
MLKPLALFMLGGAANGKSSVVRALFCTDENPEDVDLPALESERWCGPDREKAAIRMFTNAPGDAEAVERFGQSATIEPKLGGASGPSNRAQFERYPDEVREQAENVVRALNQLSVSAFANWWLAKQNPYGDGDNFGAGLTHEISKALAYVKLMRCLDESNPRRPFVWSAVRCRSRKCGPLVARAASPRRSSTQPTCRLSMRRGSSKSLHALKVSISSSTIRPSRPTANERWNSDTPMRIRLRAVRKKIEGSITEPSIKP